MTDVPIRVVTHRNWLAEQFAPYGGVHDFGVDIDPSSARDVAWWAPGEWAARAAATGVALELASCGVDWVRRLDVPDYWLRRKVVIVSAGEAVKAAEEMLGDTIFVKLPEAKTDAFPARLSFKSHLGQILASPLIGEDTLVQLSEEIQFSCEARFFVANHRVVAASWYQYNGLWWMEEDFEGGTAYEMSVLTDMANAVAGHRNSPSGYTVDVGLIRGSNYTPAIVEFNAAWSSNPYDADMGGVAESVRAANIHTLPEHEQGYYRDNWLFDTSRVPGVHRALPIRLA